MIVQLIIKKTSFCCISWQSWEQTWSPGSSLSISPWKLDCHHLTQTGKNPHKSNTKSRKLQLIFQLAFSPMEILLVILCRKTLYYGPFSFLYFDNLKLLLSNFSSEVPLTARDNDRTQVCTQGNSIPSQIFFLS